MTDELDQTTDPGADVPDADEQLLADELEKAGSPEVVILDVAGAGDSQQQDESGPDEWTPDGTIAPPEDLWQLMKLSSHNGTRRGIIEAIALNTVGLGSSLEPCEGAEQQLPRDEPAKVLSLLDACAEKDWRLDSPGFGELMQAVKTDEEGCGNGYVEISRNRITGQIDGFYHLPGHQLRRRKDRKGWIMGRRDEVIGGTGSEARRFYNFGDKVQYDDEGKARDVLKPGRNWATNEVLRFRIFTSESRDYGLPRDVALVADYAGDRKAAETNLSFFDSSGVPPTILFVQGTETEAGGRITFKVPQRAVDKIAATMRQNPGGGNRVAIVPLPPGATTSKEELGQLSERDMAFTEYRGDIASRQMSAYRIAPIFLAIDAGGRYTAEVERAITLEQVFDPEQRRYERRIDRVLRDMGYGSYHFKFKRLAVEADAARRDSAEQLADANNITVGEHRKAHGFPLYREAAQGAEPKEEDGEKPFGFNDLLLSELDEEEGGEEEGNGEEEHGSVSENGDQRGLRPGIGTRKRKRKPNPGQTAAPADPGSSAAIAKCADDDLPDYMHAITDELEADLTGVLSGAGSGNGNGAGPTSGDDG